MKVYLSFVLPGGGKREGAVEVEMPQAPSSGDWIRLIDKDSGEASKFARDFTVGQVQWEFREEGGKVAFDSIRVECEYALSPQSSAGHQRAYELCVARAGKQNEIGNPF